MGSKIQKFETIFSYHIIKKQFGHTIEETEIYEEMNLQVEQLSQTKPKQFEQDYLSSPVCQENYIHRLEINEHGVYQSSFGEYGRNRPLLKSAISFNKQQKYHQNQQQHQQQSQNNSYISTDQLEMPQLKDSSLHSFAGIYKSSKNAVEFASNFEQYLIFCLPSYVWIGLMFLLILWGLVQIIVGTTNLPFCPSRPMIPVFLIIMGCLYILWGMLRIYAFWPRSRVDTLSVDLTCKALEGVMIVAMLVSLFYGKL
ncbi:hypothetical protein X798_04766 [Onchocerca flexuosa]|uniref:Uncharacterized protein n=1 Tax=Onchocerca flexuosa TaxID=387005 RepID=A0A238BS79_9BILA|nr:hypothetical protein X798_04766 [Onchocerca flexuosa]